MITNNWTFASKKLAVSRGSYQITNQQNLVYPGFDDGYEGLVAGEQHHRYGLPHTHFHDRRWSPSSAPIRPPLINAHHLNHNPWIPWWSYLPFLPDMTIGSSCWKKQSITVGQYVSVRSEPVIIVKRSQYVLKQRRWISWHLHLNYLRLAWYY